MNTDTTTEQTTFNQSEAAKYLRVSVAGFVNYRRTHPHLFPHMVIPINGRHVYTKETLDNFKREMLTPRPVEALSA